jgi:tetratricopeptide (TPR) repeat protein
MAALLLLAAAFLLPHTSGFSPGASAQASQSPPPTISSYQALLEQYRHGSADAAVAEIVSWDARRIIAVTPPPDALAVADEKVLQAMAMLHLEAIVKGAPREPHLPPAYSAFAWLVKRQASSAFVRGWYIAMRSVLMSQGGGTQGMARPIAPDAELLLLGGSEVEALATIMMIVDGYDHDSRRNFEARLAEAEEKYREALAMDATLVEAHLRLGRVLTLRGRLDEARGELERARGEATTGYLRYLAALFLGQVHERAGRFKAASACYESAIGEYPDSQTAYVALGRVLQLSGDHDAGWSAVRKMFGEAAPRNPEHDPWWVHWYGQYWQINRRIADLRAMVRR